MSSSTPSPPDRDRALPHEVLDAGGRPSQAEGEDEDDASHRHVVLDAEGKPSQADG